MKYCPHCHVKVASDKNICPLCFSVLKEDESKQIIYQAYPHKKEKHRMDLTHKILLFISLIVILASLFVNHITFDANNPVYWSILVLFGIPYIWLSVRYVIMVRGLWANKILYQALYTVVVLLVLDTFCNIIIKDFTSFWSITYAIPGLLMFVTLGNFILGSCIKGLFIDSIANLWIFNFLLMAYFGFSFIAPSLFNPYITWACLLVSLSVQIGMIIFHRKDTLEELTKRFHIK